MRSQVEGEERGEVRGMRITSPMTPQELIDWLTKVPDCSGNVTVGRDEVYGVHAGADQEHGYVARTIIKGAAYSGRGLTVEESLKNLGEKLKAKIKL